MTVRVLGRAFLEAWLTALYIHFGGDEALERVAQDTLHQVTLSHKDLKDFDQRLQRDKGKATARAAKIRHDNAGIARRNAANPGQPATPLRDEPYIPQLTPTGIDISKRITEDFNGITPRPLPHTARPRERLRPGDLPLYLHPLPAAVRRRRPRQHERLRLLLPARCCPSFVMNTERHSRWIRIKGRGLTVIPGR